MKEIEVKIPNINTRVARVALADAGALRVMKPTVFQEWYFEIPGVTKKKRDFYSFRLRTEGKKSMLCAKVKKKDARYQVNDEIEVEVLDVEGMRSLLRLVGFHVFRQREKVREMYEFGNLHIAIDRYPGVPPYLEVEGMRKRDVLNFVKKLGYSSKDASNKTATDLIRKAGLNPDSLFFKAG